MALVQDREALERAIHAVDEREFSKENVMRNFTERSHGINGNGKIRSCYILFYIWQFPDSGRHILEGKWIFSYKRIQNLLSGAGMDAWWPIYTCSGRPLIMSMQVCDFCRQ